MTYRLLSVAENELAETTLWYERQSKGLGGISLMNSKPS